jgi:hypothetical protein
VGVAVLQQLAQRPAICQGTDQNKMEDNQITKEDTNLWITDDLTNSLRAEFWNYFTPG